MRRDYVYANGENPEARPEVQTMLVALNVLILTMKTVIDRTVCFIGVCIYFYGRFISGETLISHGYMVLHHKVIAVIAYTVSENNVLQYIRRTTLDR